MEVRAESGAGMPAPAAEQARTVGGAVSAIKQNLFARFSAYLDGLDEHELEGIGAAAKGPNEASDLASVFVELAALRSDVRTQSRLVKEALEQFRSVFATLQASHASMDQELKRARTETAERQ